ASEVLAVVRSCARRRSQLTQVTDANGTKIGERVRWDAQSPSEAEIVWNEGARLFYIDAPSLQHALTFEKSNVWKRSGCWDFRSLPSGTEQIVGRERRERVSQLASCGEGCFDSRRRVNSTARELYLHAPTAPLDCCFAL